MESSVCCWEVRTWISVIAWLHIAASSVGIAWLSILTATSEDMTDFDDDAFLTYKRMALIECLVALLTGVALLGGIAMERTCLLWTWIIVESAMTAVLLLLRIHEAASAGLLAMFPSAVGLPVFCFNMWIVRAYIHQIETAHLASSGMSPNSRYGCQEEENESQI